MTRIGHWEDMRMPACIDHGPINEHELILSELIGRYAGNNDPRLFEECCFTSVA